MLDHMIKNSKNDSDKNFYILPEYGTIPSPERSLILFNQLLDFSRKKPLYPNQLLNYALSVLIMEVSQKFIESLDTLQTNLPPNISLIEEWIRSNYYIALSVKDIAREFGYNPNYLSALFKRVTKTTLVNYIHRQELRCQNRSSLAMSIPSRKLLTSAVLVMRNII